MPIDELFALYPLAFVVTALLLGLVVGSFLNVLVWRLPKMLERDWRQQAQDVLGLPGETPLPTYNLMLPHSECPHCAHRIRAVGKHSAAQLSVAARALLRVRSADQQTLSADRTGLRPALGIYRLAFRFWLAGVPADLS